MPDGLAQAGNRGAQVSLFDKPTKQSQPALGHKSLDGLTDDAIRSGFHPVAVGKNLIELIDRSLNPVEDAIAYAAILAKARVARVRGRPKGEHPGYDR